MSQIILLKKICKYLEYTKSDLLSGLTDPLDIINLENHYNELTKDLNNGVCCGLAILHAAMDEIGKLSWWESLLVQITNWDERRETLEKELVLPQSSHPEKLSSLVERALNYVNFHQVTEFSQKYHGVFDQSSLLDPTTGFFELLDERDYKNIKTLTIQQREDALGHFQYQELMNIFNEKQMSDHFIFISNSNHRVRVFLKNKKWCIYDANNNHCDVTTLILSFNDKSELIKTIQSQLGPYLRIEIATCDKDKKLPQLQCIENLEADVIARLFEKESFFILARYKPEFLFFVLEKMATLPDGLKLVADTLSNTNEDGWTGLQVVAQYSPASFDRVLDIALRLSDGVKFITETLSLHSNKGWTGFQAVAAKAPTSLNRILDIASGVPDGCKLIAETLAHRSNNGWTGLQTITYFAPASLDKSLDMALEAPNGATFIASALAESDHDGWTGIQFLAQCAPTSLDRILDMVLRVPELSKLIAKALSQRNDEDGLNGLETIAQYNPASLDKALDIVSKATFDPEYICKILQEKDENGMSPLMYLLTNLPEKGLSILLKYAPSLLDKKLIQELLFSESQHTKTIKQLACELTLNHDIKLPKHTWYNFLLLAISKEKPWCPRKYHNQIYIEQLKLETWVDAIKQCKMHTPRKDITFFAKEDTLDNTTIGMMLAMTRTRNNHKRYLLAKLYILENREAPLAKILSRILSRSDQNSAPSIGFN